MDANANNQDLTVEFSLENIELDAEYNLENENNIDADFLINAAGTVWGSISGTLSNQEDLQAALDLKADKSELESDMAAVDEAISNVQTVVENNYNTLDNKIDIVQSDLSGDISVLRNDLTTEISNRTTADNTLQGNIDTIQNTINNYGDIVSYNASDFATAAQGLLADTALQPNDNITLLNNNAGFITNAVNNLTNYYLKSETYTKLEVQQLIASIPQFSVEVVQSLPVTGERMVLYLVPKQGEAPDVYNEYIWVEDEAEFELIGSTAVDLTGYAKESWVLSQGYITGINQADVIDALGYTPYNATNPNGYITSSALNDYATETFVNNGLATKQNTLTAGDNITINGDTISAVDTTYTAGTGISIENGVISNTQTSAEWGNIEGNIADQTDLIELLDGKQDLLTSENAGTGIEIVNGAGGDDTISGNGSILLEKAVADGLNYVTLSGACEQTYLPLGYTLVDGITNTSTGAKIDTDIVADTTAFEMEVRVKPSSGSWYIFQSRGSSEGITGIGGSISGSTIAGYYLGTSVTSAITRDTSHIYFVKLTLNNGNMTLYVKDETANVEDTQTTTYSTSDTPTENLYLWGNSQNNLVADNTIYMARLKKNGVTVLDYTPCIYNNTAGFYDTASKSFKTKTSVSGAIVAGDVLPNPTNPLPIVCNNGELKTKNLVKVIYACGMTASSNMYQVGATPLSGSYTTTSAKKGICAIIPVVAGKTYVRSGSVTNVDYKFTTFYANLTDVGVPSRALSTITTTTFTVPSGATCAVVGWVAENAGTTITFSDIQVELGSTATDYLPYGELYADGITETITDNANNTATAEMLLSMGDYKDTQELLSGVVTRNIGIKVLNGTETWTAYSQISGLYYTENTITNNQIGSASPLDLFCTHFAATDTATFNEDNVLRFQQSPAPYVVSSHRLYIKCSEYSTVALFKQFLATQYANGTPVIIVYPLATPTTETVTGQTLTTVQGDNTLTITQASIENLPIEANYNLQGGTVINFVNDSGFITSSDVGNGTITINQGGTQKGTFTLNQSGDTTIDLDAGGGGAVDSVNGQTGTVILTASDVGALADTTTIPTKTSDLTNDSGYITSSALSPYVLTSSLATVATSGDYDDLTNKPTIPTATSDLTNDSGFITNSALADYVTNSSLSTTLADYVLSSSLATVATSGSYNDLSNKPAIPTVPTNISAFTNDIGYATETFVTNQGYLTNDISQNVKLQTENAIVNSGNRNLIKAHGTHTYVGNATDNLALFGSSRNPYYNGNELALLSDIPTTISSFTNDSGYITASDIPSEIFVVEYGTTAYNEISNAITANKTIVCHKSESWGEVYAPLDFEVTATSYTFSSYLGTNFYQLSVDNNDDWSSSNSAYVDKSGDTMTGNLAISNSSFDKLILKDTNQIAGTTPSANTGSSLAFRDSNDTLLGYVQNIYTTSNERRTNIACRNADATDITTIQLGFNSSGNAFCTFPNTTCCDGQWVYQTENIVPSDTSLNGSTPLTYTLANVPNDGHEYEVLLNFWATTGSTNGNYVAVLVYSDKITSETYVCRATTRTSSTATCAGSIILPLSTNRKIYVVRQTGINGTFQCRLRGYRRIGTNA